MLSTFSIDVVFTHDNAWDHLKKSVAAFVEFGGDDIRQIVIIDDAPTFRTAFRVKGD